ncbi:MAG: OB-fold domain-containing protein [bacterium]|nr:OB-fold domain-containing protein [bacterium]MCY3633708.1 OB-fold domain-containing protein [bacterium]
MTDNPFGDVQPGVFPTILTETHADESTQPFWDAAKQNRLVAPRCTNCGTFRLPPEAICFECQHREVEWVELPGTGTIFSRIIVRHPLHPGLAPVVPYVVGVVELDGTQGAGARMLVNIIDCDPEAIAIGDRVQIAFEHVNEEMSVPRFRPTERQG